MDFSLTLCRYSTETVKGGLEDVKDNWTASTVGSIHWDGNLSNTLIDKGRNEECIPVLFSGWFENITNN